jgi:hypothetical protein
MPSLAKAPLAKIDIRLKNQQAMLQAIMVGVTNHFK